MSMSKRTELAKQATTGRITPFPRMTDTCVEPLASEVANILAGYGVHVVDLSLSKNEIVIKAKLLREEMTDRLLKSVLPVFRELSKTETLTAFPASPSPEKIQLKNGIAEAKEALRKRGHKL